jgi:hypothetical protein
MSSTGQVTSSTFQAASSVSNIQLTTNALAGDHAKITGMASLRIPVLPHAQWILIDLSKACGDVPNELYVKETIEKVSLNPIYMGGLGHIHRGLCNGRLVALNRLFELENDELVQVRGNHTGVLTF